MIQTVETIIKKLTKNPTKYWTRVRNVASNSKCVEFNYPIHVKITLERMPIDDFILIIEPEHLQSMNMIILKEDGLRIKLLINELEEACVQGTREYLTNIILSL
jgi:hypothetical protein